MKVAILTTDSRENRKTYHEVSPSFGTAPQGLLDGFARLAGDEARGIEFHVISCCQHPMRSPEKLEENIYFHSLHVPKAGWLRSGYLGCALAVKHRFSRIKPDIVHAHGTERDCAVSAVFSRRPRILTIHGNLRLIRRSIGFKRFSPTWFQSFLEGACVSRFDGIISISNYTNRAIANEVPKSWVIPNAADPAFFLAPDRPEKDKDSHEPTILLVANIDKRKNQNNFIRALSSIRGKLDFELRCFGICHDDEYGREFRSLIKQNQNWCFYGGMLNREKLLTEFQNATLLVLPTLEDNCPMVVLEALASGVPIVATAVGGIPELIDHGKTGLLVPDSDPDAMNTAISNLLTDSGLRRRFSEAGRSQAVSRFHPAVIAKKHIQVYREILDSRAHSGQL